MSRIIYLIILDVQLYNEDNTINYQTAYHTIIEAYERLFDANDVVETIFRRFVNEHEDQIVSGVAPVGNKDDRLGLDGEVSCRIPKAKYTWRVSEEVLRERQKEEL